MIKIKPFNVMLTLAAFAALFFLLPPDKEVSKVSEHKSQATMTSQQGLTRKANQVKSVRGNLLHSA